MEQVNLLSAKVNFQILESVEQFRIVLDERAGKTERAKTHKNHLNFILEIKEVFQYMDKSNQVLSSRNMELNYANTKLLHEIDQLKEINNNLINGI